MPVIALANLGRALAWFVGGFTGMNEDASLRLRVDVPLELARLVGWFLLVQIVLRPENAQSLVGLGFVSAATLALLCFTYALALPEAGRQRDLVLEVGRKLMLAAVLMLVLAPLVLMMRAIESWAAGTGRGAPMYWMVTAVGVLFVAPIALSLTKLLTDSVVELARILMPGLPSNRAGPGTSEGVAVPEVRSVSGSEQGSGDIA